jgi:hypothetical protein
MSGLLFLSEDQIILATMPAPTYIISRFADPIFAVFIGLSAAAMRINREEREKGKTSKETIDTLRRYEVNDHQHVGQALITKPI